GFGRARPQRDVRREGPSRAPHARLHAGDVYRPEFGPAVLRGAVRHRDRVRSWQRRVRAERRLYAWRPSTGRWTDRAWRRQTVVLLDVRPHGTARCAEGRLVGEPGGCRDEVRRGAEPGRRDQLACLRVPGRCHVAWLRPHQRAAPAVRRQSDRGRARPPAWCGRENLGDDPYLHRPDRLERTSVGTSRDRDVFIAPWAADRGHLQIARGAGAPLRDGTAGGETLPGPRYDDRSSGFADQSPSLCGQVRA